MKDFDDLNMLWSEAHTLHLGVYNCQSIYSNDDLNDLLYASPNHSLLSNNNFFNTMLRNPDKVYIMHVTRNLERILQTKVMYPSAGCLIGCIYGTQLYKESGNLFRMHNLGKYILQQEATFGGGKAVPIVIEVSFKNQAHRPILSGINYLKLGRIHQVIYDQLRYLLSPGEQYNLEAGVAQKISKSLGFLDLCSKIYNGEKQIDGRDVLAATNNAIPSLSILGYIYFEALAEYTMLFSRDELTRELRTRGEYNNTIYKSFLFDIYQRVGKFKLSDFSLTVDEIARKIDSFNRHETAKLDLEECIDYVAHRVVDMVMGYAFSSCEFKPRWLDISWDYQGFSQFLGPLVGHMVHRELRNFNRYHDFYFYFDQVKALSVWNYWNKMDIALPFNAPMPKGEIGINPAYQNALYKIYIGKQSETSSDMIELKDEIDVEIVPRLIDLRHTVMRSQDYDKGSKT